MSGKHRDSGRDAVSWLATAFVVFLGLSGCGFVILVFANEPRQPVLVISGTFLALAILFWVLREKPKQTVADEEAKWLGIFAKPKRTLVYKLTRHKPPKIVQFGINQPPTAEQIREIKELSDGMKNWVPPPATPTPVRNGPNRVTAGGANLGLGAIHRWASRSEIRPPEKRG